MRQTLCYLLSPIAFCVLIGLTANFLASEETPKAAPDVEMTELFVRGQDGYHTYRIPALVRTNEGTLLALCEGRKHSQSDTGDIDLLLKRSTDGGLTWSKQQIVWNDEKNTCGNPCPIVDRETGTIWLLLTWNRGDDREKEIRSKKSKDTRRVFVAGSTDDGKTWTKPKEITRYVKQPGWTWYATGPGNGIQLTRGRHKGRLVAPCDHNIAGTMQRYSHVIYSDDHGKTWQLGGASPRDKTNECAVVELTDGRLLLNMRNYSPGKNQKKPRAVCYSVDGGLTWIEPGVDESLVELACQASMIRYTWPEDSKDGKSRILFCNPASKWRQNLTVRMSYDEGKTWPVSRVLHAGPSAYSSLAVSPDGEIFCLFENGEKAYYEKISLARFRLE